MIMSFERHRASSSTDFTQAEGTQFPPCFPLSFIPSPALQDGTLKKQKNGTFATLLITLKEVQK